VCLSFADGRPIHDVRSGLITIEQVKVDQTSPMTVRAAWRRRTETMGWGGALHEGYGERAVSLPREKFIWGSRSAYFGAFSGPSDCLLLPVIRTCPDLEYACHAV